MFRVFLFIVLSFCSYFFIYGKDVVIYQKVDPKNTRYNEYIDYLRSALEKTKDKYGSYELKQSPEIPNEFRALKETKRGIVQNITWYGSNEQYERELIPIYIPLGKGILGYRVFLIRKEKQDEFNKVKTIDDLKKFKFAHGYDWGDLPIYKYNGFNVETDNYENLFRMISLKVADVYSRGIGEAYHELEERKSLYPDMAVEERVAMYYMWPFILYVSPKTPRIAERVEAGLQLMRKDGTFDKIFMKYNGDVIKKADLKNRTLIKIINPYVTPKFNSLDSSFWYDPLKE